MAIVAVLTAFLLLLGAGQALASHCTVAKKPVGSGSKVIIDLTTEQATVTGSGRGGFTTLDFNGDGIGDADAFRLPVTPALEDDLGVGVGTLPASARNAGPGDNFCDGKGVDDLLACGG
jgi:hypothetical protein